MQRLRAIGWKSEARRSEEVRRRPDELKAALDGLARMDGVHSPAAMLTAILQGKVEAPPDPTTWAKEQARRIFERTRQESSPRDDDGWKPRNPTPEEIALCYGTSGTPPAEAAPKANGAPEVAPAVKSAAASVAKARAAPKPQPRDERLAQLRAQRDAITRAVGSGTA